MRQLTPTDLLWVVSRLPKSISDMLKERPLIAAGGFIRSTIAGEKIHDYDLFGPDKDAVDKAATWLKNEYGDGTRIFNTENAITVLCPPRTPVQFITRWNFSKVAECVESFDFTVCQAAIAFDPLTKKWFSLIHDDFYSDLAARRLVYTSPIRNEDAGGSMMRVRKYLSRGYNIQAESLGAVIARLIKGVKAPTHVFEESKLAWILAGLLREVDPLIIVDGVETVHEVGHDDVERSTDGSAF